MVVANTTVNVRPGINRNFLSKSLSFLLSALIYNLQNNKTVDIERWIEKHSEQHKDLVKILKSNKFTNKHRRDLVKIVVSEMNSEWGNM